MPRVVERDRAGHEGEAEVTAPDGSLRPSGSPQRVVGAALALGLAGLFGIGLVVLGGVFEPGDLVAEGILETRQRILHARRGAALREAHLMLGDLQRLEHPVFIVAGECECVLIWHNRKDSGGASTRKRDEMKPYAIAPRTVS